ncbi:MAG: oligoendopeptidase F [Clostridiales bacterium GWE2_32_10]|nr:MAG: oligoendopeptidase F [Clostridiales bacterium GWE2_32_10]HBY20812.1 oligoendopeptidase F [Clostridiales bacterium]
MAIQPRKREEIEEKYKWRLEDIYASNDLWEKDFSEVDAKIGELVKYKGVLTDSAENLYNGLELDAAISRVLEKLSIYAKMRKDENLNVAAYQEMTDRIQSLVTKFSSESAFMKTELVKLTSEKLTEYIEKEERLKLYEYLIEKLLRFKPHILSESEEKIVAMAGDVLAGAGNIYGMLNNADIKFPKFIGEDNNEVVITQENVIRYLRSSDRSIRKDVFEKFYETFMSYKNTFASTLNTSIKSDIFITKTKKYESTIKSALFPDNVDISVYNNLIEAVHNNLDKLQKYCDVKKQVLKLDEFHMYDAYVSMLNDVDKKISYEEAVETIKDVFKIFGEDYYKAMSNGLESGWVDVYDSEGKRGGGYMCSCYEAPHPYILLNHQNDLQSLFTLAHEMGHAMHSYYSKNNQPYIYASYTIFVAEVASTVNEVLLMKHLLKNTTNVDEKLYLVDYFMEKFRTTVYRQTKFAEFEKITYEKIEKGEALSADKICEIYYNLHKLYYGENVVSDDLIKIEWARIPHFYRSFYVYKYATGFSAAIALAEKISSGDKNALSNYLEFLKTGGSDYPIELLKKAGVDMSTPEPVQKALDFFGELINEFEKLISTR